MDIHEFQAKNILRKYGIPVPAYAVISDVEQVDQALSFLHCNRAVIKVQVHAGGRGKAGGVKMASNRQEIIERASQLLGMKIVNSQTGPEGVVAQQVLISEAVNIRKELYVGVVVDRTRGVATLLLSPEGGTEIEELAATRPESILTIPLSPEGGLKNFRLQRIAKFMGWSGQTAKEGLDVIQRAAKAFMETDASLLEINPLVETFEGKIVAVDAKLSIDDNALFRQPEIAAYYDSTQRSASEAQAKKCDLAYVALEGNIGCMVNGAGLAMATMDIIQHYGGAPANFLDVGGGASQEKVAEGFKIILSDSKVKAILVNIFGGIMSCATLAGGVLEAASQLHIHVPLIVRLEGTHVELGKKMLSDSHLDIMVADSLSDAAQKAVRAAQS